MKHNALVVEDDFINQRFIRTVLQTKGINVETAGNASEAIEFFEKNQYDIVFMDVNLPDKNGNDVTRQIRSIEKKLARPKVPIIALTAYDEEEARTDIDSAGMDGFIGKPFQDFHVEEMLKRFVYSKKRKEQQLRNNGENDNSTEENQKEKTHIEKLQQILGLPEDVLKPLIKEFIETTDERIKGMRQANKDGNIIDLQHRAHKLKGSAANLRFESISELADKIEKSAASGTEKDYSDDINNLENILAEVKKEVS